MEAITDWALANLADYGAPLLLVVAYLGSLGLPFPITVVIMAAGALARTGVLNWPAALLACVVGAALADHSEYLLGRLAQPWISRRFGHTRAWQQAQTTLARQGGWAILLTRFWLMPLAPAINVLSGARYPLVRFVCFDLLGQLLWVLLYGGLGYLFAAQWQQLSQAAGVFSAVSFGLFVVGLLVNYGVRRYRTQAKR